jgi:SAM-dependent methyltransferase
LVKDAQDIKYIQMVKNVVDVLTVKFKINKMKKFTVQEVYDIYNKHCNLSYDYFIKYENILDFINHPDWDQIIYKPVRTDFPRIWTILDFKEWIEKYNINPINKLLVTCDDPEEFYLKYNYKRKADYEVDRDKYDLHWMDLDEKDFDFLLFSQTLEHVWNPQMVMERIAAHVKPGGHVFTSVPTVNMPHMTPIHFQGFTPMGLVMLFIGAGFEVLEVGQFGNQDYTNYLFDKGWPFWTDLIDKNNQIKNNPRQVAQCWILAKKL